MKIVYGENFITIEEADELTNEEIFNTLEQIEKQYKKVENLTLMLSPERSVSLENDLRVKGYCYTDAKVFYYHPLKNWRTLDRTEIEWVSPDEDSFMKHWLKVMEGSLNPRSALNMDEHMSSVKKELGSAYKKSCLTASIDGEIAGVAMPHIEPGTKGEGRLFYFGMLPNHRGTGLAKDIHLASLKLLAEEFDASYYIGATSHKNTPMLKVFENNGCHEKARKKVYKKKITPQPFQ
ncbi:GNAT family N-acetyltransferase [Halobacillus sp. Marseille-Q1614]|uniref:GNAT family N-acetyltransferase n=1 Tax=Halobacillus sp. Marseille-Q1614 TaxID=2709134 RepID=UPI0015702F7B|nr:GNAT family N-acetyltransferase [Halobacillus sp. Marseille-Q1614]